jgi:integrase
MKALTVAAIEKLKPGPTRREIPDGRISGLYLVVQPAPSGRKSWAIRYRHNGRTRKFTLEHCPPAALTKARRLAADALEAVAEGKDPAAEKRDQQRRAAGHDRDLVRTVAERFIDRHCKANTREATWRETERIFKRDILPVWGNRLVGEISRRDVLDLLDRAVDRGAPVLANRVLATVRRFFNWCAERDIVAVSPCTGIRPPTAESSRDRVLSDDELRAVWRACEEIGWPFGAIVQLLIVTGQRREEVGKAAWAEFDLDRKLWTIPRERVKNNTAHEVPLNGPALAVVKALPKIKSKAGYLFTTGEKAVSGYSRAKRRVDEKAGLGEPWTLHDLRRTAASGMARLGAPLPVIEKILNHTSGSFAGVVGVYQRHSFANEKRAALVGWGRHVEHIVSGKPAKVIRLAERRR